jgi:putative NIF3 family GTP cyclohydrolase 1 type 2
MYHPIVMECGDPKGDWGKGFTPIEERYIEQIKEKKLSIYTCHIPMDCHDELGPHIAMARALDAKMIETIEDYIVICKINKMNTQEFISIVIDIFNIPYVDFEGVMKNTIETIAIVAGCGDVVDWMKAAEEKGVQAYLTGEIHCHIDNEYGKKKYAEMKKYATETTMSLIGVSHAASEFLVHKTLMNDWFKQNFNVNTVIIPQEKWWV